MRKSAEIALLFLVAIVGIWIAVNAVLRQESRSARNAAESALRDQLDVPEPKPGDSPRRSSHPTDLPFDKPEGELPEDTWERWQRAFSQADDLFDYETDTDAERFLNTLYRGDTDWTEGERAALRTFLDEHETLIAEIIALTELQVPQAFEYSDAVSGVTHLLGPYADGVEGCINLLIVASSVEADSSDFVRAREAFAAALSLIGSRGNTHRRHDALTALDFAAEDILRSGAFHGLPALLGDLEEVADRQGFRGSIVNGGRRMLWNSQKPIRERYYGLPRQANALAYRTFLPSVVDGVEREALVHAGRLAELAADPYYEIRDELAEMELDARTWWYEPNVYSMTGQVALRDAIYQARWEARRDMVRLAIALDEYHAATGTYPELLEPVSSWMDDASPPDVFTGEPYHYRRTDDGFTLCSSGKNGIDDAGEGDDLVLRIGGGWE